MNPLNLSSIEKKIFLGAPRSRVWRALTSIDEFSRWFGVESTGIFQPGARVQMTSTIEGHAGMSFHVTVDRMEPEHTFSWRWHPGAVNPDVDYSVEPTTLVEFHLAEVEGGTLVTVHESGFDQISLERRAAVYKDNEGGWEYQMKSLERYVDANS